jgi:hypothetical protein
MDPNETLRRIDTFLRSRRTGDVVDDWCRDLGQWLSDGGFSPDWERFSLGRSYYNTQASQHSYPMGPDAWEHPSGQILAGPGFRLPTGDDETGLFCKGTRIVRADRLMGVWMATRNARRFARALGWSGPGSHSDVATVGAVAANAGAALGCEARRDALGARIYWMIVRRILDSSPGRVLEVCSTLEVPDGIE